MEKLFDIIDIDSNGQIEWNEFLSFQAKARQIQSSWPFDVKLIRAEFKSLDSDGSGAISKDEFISVFGGAMDIR